MAYETSAVTTLHPCRRLIPWLSPCHLPAIQGVSKENVPKVEELVLSTLSKIAEEGFEQEAIDASINSIEFNLREFNTGSFPRYVPTLCTSAVCVRVFLHVAMPTG